MEIGAVCSVTAMVTDQNTAEAVESGDVPVLATPAMAALMEKAAMKLAARYLDEGQTTVGTALSITHVAATPVGMQVEATATLTGVEGATLTFAMVAKDARGVIGEGTQRRAVVNRERFLEKTYAKLRP
jgi:fluoroacetyl-CoA thioesterase